MRFTKRRFPFSHHCFCVNSDLKLAGRGAYFVNRVLSNIKGCKKKEAIYCSNIMGEDSMKNWKKICHLPLKQGVYFILSKGGEMILKVNSSKPAINGDFEVYGFAPHGLVLAIKVQDGKVSYLNGWKPETKLLKPVPSAAYFYTYAAAVVLFKEFAEVKAKYLPPKKKVKNHHGRYKNDLPFSISICDLNWYTESLQCHPFVVRWHWRAQRYGKGLKKVKLIKIDEFIKRGYKKGAYKNNVT